VNDQVDRGSQYEDAAARHAVTVDVKRLIVEGLDLPIDSALLDDDQPLFGRGLELDSLDTLEIVSLLEEEFQTYITDDQKFVFGSVNNLVDFILSEREAGG